MQAKGISPLAGVHTLGNLLTNVSLGKVAVSFTHTIKVCTNSSTLCDYAAFYGQTENNKLTAYGVYKIHAFNTTCMLSLSAQLS